MTAQTQTAQVIDREVAAIELTLAAAGVLAELAQATGHEHHGEAARLLSEALHELVEELGLEDPHAGRRADDAIVRAIVLEAFEAVRSAR